MTIYNSTATGKSGRKNIFVLAFILLVTLMLQPSAQAKALITGQYISSSGKKIILNLNILNPAPANFIVEQYLSPRNSVISTSPKAKKGSPGKIKWLFRNSASGRLSISIQLQSSLQGAVRGVIRYRHPVNGDFVEFSITP